MAILLNLVGLMTLANLIVMFISNIYNFIDTIKSNRHHKAMREELKKLMVDTMEKITNEIEQNKTEE